MSLMLLRAANSRRAHDHVRVEELLLHLGDRSFGWTLLLFAIVNLLPLPPGSTLITGIPLLIITIQMAMGRRHVVLPRIVMRRRVSRGAFRRSVHRVKPVLRIAQRGLKARGPDVFSPQRERIVGLALFAISATLFLPVPLSAWGPAVSLSICALGLIEKDGKVVLAGLGAGLLSLLATLLIVVLVLANALG